ncbi:RcnB family protein [Sphingomonas hankookensis]|uniref:RcnB family protein n=1 Tax=Sphingomonas hankookensis TaxID=563996 RepID=UPI001F5ADBEB|nr:RcnB family protein [Sphingomonas hankookensis]
MRKILLAALAATIALPAVAAPAMAQSARELRRDRQDIREERRDLNRAQRNYRENLRDRAWGRNDWRAYRQGHRNLYARGNWNAPFRYQAFRPGLAIGRPYYAQRYWIANPGRYRLPPARGGYQRWVRHYNDALLIDQRRGRVIDVIRNFYW